MEPSLEAAWSAAWRDFLCNRVAVAERRAAGWLRLLDPALSQPSDPELLVTLADLAHIAAAARGDVGLLRQAAAAYEAHLRLEPSNEAALRMLAETFLRLRDYAAAFACFERLHAASLSDAAPVDVAPFRLLHDAECIEEAVRLGADRAALTLTKDWRSLADQLTQSHACPARARCDVCVLDERQRGLIGSRFGQPLPIPPSREAAPAIPAAILRAGFDWRQAEAVYARERVVVVDDLLDEAALRELQLYSRHGAHFRTQRRGYLGCFPADGLTHPLVLSLVTELEKAAPSIFKEHALALWWMFKYDESNPDGIGIHADPAAVNINLWLTDESACLEGGGLAIYKHVPQLEQATQACPPSKHAC
ncbi:MAG: hypothetical protein SGPRY_012225, partial [Prymnesium sp.]